MYQYFLKLGLSLWMIFFIYQGALADTLAKLGEIKRGEIHDFSVVTLMANHDAPGVYIPSNRFVVAMRDSADKLRMMVVEVSNTGEQEVIANTVTEGTIKSVSVGRVSSNRVVVAVRDSSDRLRLIAFDIKNNGRSIERLGTKVSRKVREVSIAGDGDIMPAATPNNRIFTAATDADGNLFVVDWKVRQDGRIKSLGSETYGPATRLNVENGQVDSYFVSVVMRDSEGSLKLVAFQTPDETGIQRGGSASGGKIREAKSTGYNFELDIYTVSISEGPIAVWGGLTPINRYDVDAGFLKIIRWAHKSNAQGLINISSKNFERKAERELTGAGRTDAKYEGMAQTADIMNFYSNLGGFRTEVITAHAGFGSFKKLHDEGKRRLRIIAWDKNLGATSKIHLGGEYTQVELTPLNTVNEVESARFATVLRGVRGELKIVVWALNLSS